MNHNCTKTLMGPAEGDLNNVGHGTPWIGSVTECLSRDTFILTIK